jgi:uncharacterized caspase-like protein
MNNTSAFHQGYALLVGVGADLPVTIEDAVAVQDILLDSERCAYPAEHVRLLTGEQATRANILAELDWLRNQVQAVPAATVIVYFSGHGGLMPAYHLVPYGYNSNDLAGSAISGTEFTERLLTIKAQKLLVLLDCCHAGGMAGMKAAGFEQSPTPPELHAALRAGSGTVVIASSRKDEVSYTGTPYSIFTQALREGLAGYGAADRDGYAYVADIAMYIGRVVPARTSDRQHPILKLSAADNFAVAYYAAGAKSPRPLAHAATYLIPLEELDVNIAAKYQDILNKYQLNLLKVEERMAEFFDQAAVPLDLERSKEKIVQKISDIESTIEQYARASGWYPTTI